MTQEELERRMRALAAAGVRGTPSVVGAMGHGGYSVRAYIGWFAWADIQDAASEDVACDLAWLAVVVRLCDEVERARRALDVARGFGSE